MDLLKKLILALCLLAPLNLAAAEMTSYYAPVWLPIHRITKEELRGKLGQKNMVIADVRYFAPLDEGKILGAVRYTPYGAADWGRDIPEDVEIVLY